MRKGKSTQDGMSRNIEHKKWQSFSLYLSLGKKVIKIELKQGNSMVQAKHIHSLWRKMNTKLYSRDDKIVALICDVTNVVNVSIEFCFLIKIKAAALQLTICLSFPISLYVVCLHKNEKFYFQSVSNLQ